MFPPHTLPHTYHNQLERRVGCRGISVVPNGSCQTGGRQGIEVSQIIIQVVLSIVVVVVSAAVAAVAGKSQL